MISIANLCSFDGDKSVSSSRCIHSLLTDLNLLVEQDYYHDIKHINFMNTSTELFNSLPRRLSTAEFPQCVVRLAQELLRQAFPRPEVFKSEITHLNLKVVNLNLSLNSWLYFSRRSRGRGRCRIVGGSAEGPDCKTISVSLFCSDEVPLCLK